MAKRITVDELQALATSRGGEFLSLENLGWAVRHLWRCAEGHEWEASIASVKGQGAWCPACSVIRRGIAKRVSVEDLRNLAKSRGGEFLSPETLGWDAKHLWRCAEGHEWESSIGSVKGGGSWCPVCNGGVRGNLEQLQEAAQSRGGECLSSVYIDCFTEYQWRCADGHKWMSKASNIMGGTWCPECWSRKKTEVKLDISLFKAIAIERGGQCISDVYAGVQEYLTWNCAKGHTWNAIGDSVKNGTWCPFCSGTREKKSERTYTCANDFAESRGGLVLANSEAGLEDSVRWKCSKGHIWVSKLSTAVVKNVWCLACEQDKSNRLEMAKKLAYYRLGECLSTEYVNNHSHLRWRCADGHEWGASYGSVSRGTWCPVCSRGKPRDEFHRDSLAGIQPKRYVKVEKYDSANSMIARVVKILKGHSKD